jgi:two-component system nitrogen regulation sensor histidine kinase GlnL
MSISTRNNNHNHILQRIVDNLDTVIMCFDQDFRLIYINPAGEMLFSSSEKNMVGQKACDLMHCPDVIVGINLKNALNKNQAVTEREVILPLPDNTQVVVDCSIIPVNNIVDEERGLIVEIQILDRHIRISREEQLKTQQTVTRSLVRGLAHEIKNPLGGIRGAAQLLEAELHSEELREYTQIIIGEADRLQTLVDRMLGPNKLPQKQLLNVHDVLERVRSLVLAENIHIPIWRDYDPSIPELVADNDQLIQAILNIVKNAVKALANVSHPKIIIKSRISRQMTINNKRHRLVAKFQVIDNGPGIPEELKEHIFFPLVSGTEGGVGVGLSISQTLINKHGGLIECQSQPGNTVFTIWLPLEYADD